MSIYRRSKYDNPYRLVVVLEKEDINRIDEWAAPANMPSRNEAIKTLVKKGLEAARNETSA